ncbi:hypothetical protein [Rhizobium sp. AN5]|uniref:hypothetical protein n=1 Tax=Rhizobium sp. AN5 TaxID=1855304 RepID=UPI00117AFDC2|nr:hypothetical protein [Rhizobium sp. AN5]
MSRAFLFDAHWRGAGKASIGRRFDIPATFRYGLGRFVSLLIRLPLNCFGPVELGTDSLLLRMEALLPTARFPTNGTAFPTLSHGAAMSEFWRRDED